MAKTPAITLLERQKVPHRIIEFNAEGHAGHYGQSAAAELGQAEAQVFKTLMVDLGNDRLSVAMVPVNAQLDLKAVARVFGVRKAKMASPEVAQRITGYVVGGISPLGQKKRSPAVLDASAPLQDEIFISGGQRGLEIAIAPEALTELIQAKIESIATYD